MDTLVVYIHGKGGSAAEAAHYKALFPDCAVSGMDYTAQFPWEAREEFPALWKEISGGYRTVRLIANSIGAYFAMNALAGQPIEKAYFISPVVNMEKLIRDMMAWAGVSEQELRAKQEIPTSFGETLSWNYLCYAREHPLGWSIPTHILFGEKDALTSYATIAGFARQTNATLTVMKDGEHWFHTKEQMQFLDDWIRHFSV